MGIFKKSVALAFAAAFSLGVNAQGKSYAKEIELTYKNIYNYFYDSSAGLYIEETILKPKDNKFSFLWPVCALVQTANEMEVLHPKKDYLAPVVNAITKYYSTKAPHPGYDSYVVEFGGGDRFYDDNQWIGIAYMDAYNRKNDKKFLDLSKEIYDFMLTGYDTIGGGGLYWKEFDHTTKNTCSNGPGALLGLQLYLATREKRYLDTALLIYKWVDRELLSNDGVYYDNLKLPSKQIDRAKYTYNAGTMLQTAALLYKITGDKSYLVKAKEIAKHSLEVFYKKDHFPKNYWFNVVLLRGYIELYEIDKDRTYLDAFNIYLATIARKETDDEGLVGLKASKAMIDQAGYLEMLVRMELMRKR